MDLEVRDVSRLRRMGNAVRNQKRITAIVATFVVLIMSMVAYNAWGLSQESDTPLVISVTARQRSYVESYIKDVLLKVDGHQADPNEDRRAMEMAADALLHGGKAPAPQGSL